MRKPTVRKSRNPASAAAPAAAVNAGNELGGRLRAARLRAAETVRGLARRVKVSPSLISQIELGRVQPSVGTLYAISNELGLSLADIFREEAPPARSQESRDRERGAAPAANAGPVLRSKGRKTIRLDGGVRWEQLTATTDPYLEFLYIVYEVGGASCAEDALIRHGGKEYGYIVSGRLGFRIGFEEFELGPGDSFSFDAQMPHRLWTIGNEPAVAIWAVFNRHGDSRKRPS
jgi:transcriptional regulator with XRE-family HTH domain